MMKPDLIDISFSAEYGDETLPPLKELLTDVPDENKDIILDYLKTDCILACAGIVNDIIDPDCVIGNGDLFSDGKYIWPDYLPAYIEKYNIPLPKEFRDYILCHYNERKNRHLLFERTDHVKIMNQPGSNRKFEVQIFRNGNVIYMNHIIFPVFLRIPISPDIAEYMIDPIMTQLFCYDEEDHGSPMIDAYHWEIKFYTKKGLSYKTEGWPGENTWRLHEFVDILEFAERFISQSLGSEYYQLEE